MSFAGAKTENSENYETCFKCTHINNLMANGRQEEADKARVSLVCHDVHGRLNGQHLRGFHSAANAAFLAETFSASMGRVYIVKCRMAMRASASLSRATFAYIDLS